ncbi:TPA: 30S ribosomal protein S4 [Candidatus Uhrbacteria bacterium]|nr:MAG: 30S ribosomal protein S4 [Candidatus Uhrbacteria bacterium RIFCSPHIGHO2_02_FULL_54_11]HBL39231.1 30S ribosomal protein S4 [Candidatus Uhrbacteria bacterium]
MGRLLGPIGKMSRREGVPLDENPKNPVKRRPYPPGAHGATQRRGRMSSYGIQLREKQKAKRLYGVMERQFRRYFETASRYKGNTGEMLTRFLELRLDNVVYRLGFAKTRRMSRQMVNHGFFAVNGAKVDIPSFQVSPGDIVTIRVNKEKKPIFQPLEESLKKHTTASWLHLDAAARTGKVASLPEGDDLKQVFDPTLIVEFYSR